VHNKWDVGCTFKTVSFSGKYTYILKADECYYLEHSLLRETSYEKYEWRIVGKWIRFTRELTLIGNC
jgi:hypothetical protein